MKFAFVLLAVISLAACAAKPSKEALERAREMRLTQLRTAMTQTDSQLNAAQMRIKEAKRMRNANEREAEMAAGKRETVMFLRQKSVLQAEMSAVLKETETGDGN